MSVLIVDTNRLTIPESILNREFSIGAELEFEGVTPSKAAAFIDSDYGFCKEECDTDYGFEIEGEIQDRNDFINLNEDKYSYWETLFQQIKKSGSYVPNECLGHHIHVNYKASSPDVLYKIMDTLYENKTFALIFAERDCCNQDWRRMSYQHVLNPIGYNRYFIHCNSVREDGTRTTEWRIFLSPTNVDTFLKNMQFVIAWYDLAEVMGEENFLYEKNRDLISTFIKFVEVNKSVYPQLFNFIQENQAAISATVL